MLLVCFLDYHRKADFTWSWALKIIIIVLAGGGLIEIIQSGIDGRTAGVADTISDVMGGILGIAWVGRRQFTTWQRWLMPIISGTILYSSLAPVAAFALDEWQAKHNFPLLAGFENRRELSRWTGNATWQRSNKQVRQGKYSLHVSLTTDTYSGLSLKYLPNNWHNYTALQLSIFKDNATEFAITLRVHDKTHEQGQQLHNDRFNRVFTLQPGWNDLNINLSDIKNAPSGRQMDMGNISSLGLFVTRQETKKVIFLDDVRLASGV